MIGKTISQYRTPGKLGGGGVSVVCRTYDTNLKCEVVIEAEP